MGRTDILKRDGFLDSIVLLLISAFIIKNAFSLHRFGDWSLSPALFPLGIAILIAVLAVVLLVNSIRKESRDAGGTDAGNYRKVFFVLVFSIAYLVLLPLLHFIISSIIYLVLLLITLGERRWWLIALLSGVTTVSIYFLFGSLLHVLLP
jgi:putative tricarboxylic transport membrane protein